MKRLFTSKIFRFSALAVAAMSAGLLYSCGGGQDLGGFSRNLGGDIGTGYNNSLGSRYNTQNNVKSATAERGTYPTLETSFQLANLPGDPFDYEKVNVQVTLRKPDGGSADVPAFFDGGTTWRMRYTPSNPGQYSLVTVKLNREIAHEEKLEKKEWTVSGEPQPGFVRIDKGDKSRFIFDSGTHYFPLGHNQAWRNNGQPDIPELFAKMHIAGENWSRVWMNHWDGKNLDWSSSNKPGKLGELDLEVAKHWDSIVEAAGKNSIYFQMTLQHHGQYSTTVNPNWNDNPYNTKNGGFLSQPESFFTNPQARALTKRKLYYILARWGYSPNIMAFELFNEVEGTDASRNKHADDVAMWHREMALFLRQYDGYHHLITTSSADSIPLESPVWETVDYVQSHAYPSDVITALGGTETSNKKIDKPHFFGEFGAQDLKDSDGIHLHNGLWASLMRNPSGAAEYWDWDTVEKSNLYSHFQAASAFLTASGLPNQGGLTSVSLPVDTPQKGDLRFGPGGGWDKATQNEFVVGATGVPAGMTKLPQFLQGDGNRAMMPKPLIFQVSYLQPGKFGVTIKQVAKSGGHLKISVDGKSVERDFPAQPMDATPKAGEETLQIEVPAGAHSILVENTGKDWLVVKEFTFSDYSPALAAYSRIGKEFAVAWITNRTNVDKPADQAQSLQPVTGKLNLTGLQKGHYNATWWDTHAGKSLSSAELTVTNSKEALPLTTPPITRDIALYVVKAGSAEKTAAKGSKPDKNKASNTTATLPPSGVPTNVPAPNPVTDK